MPRSRVLITFAKIIVETSEPTKKGALIVSLFTFLVQMENFYIS